MHELDGGFRLAVVNVFILHEPQSVLGADAASVLGRVLVDVRFYRLFHLLGKLGARHVKVQIS